jgi:hypothetical protein
VPAGLYRWPLTVSGYESETSPACLCVFLGRVHYTDASEETRWL